MKTLAAAPRGSRTGAARFGLSMRSNHGSQVSPPSRVREDQVERADDAAGRLVARTRRRGNGLSAPCAAIALRLARAAAPLRGRRASARACRSAATSSCARHAAVELRASSVRPPSALCRTTPSWPTAQPCVGVDEVHRRRGRSSPARRPAASARPSSSETSDVAALADRDEALAGARDAVAAGVLRASGSCARRLHRATSAKRGSAASGRAPARTSERRDARQRSARARHGAARRQRDAASANAGAGERVGRPLAVGAAASSWRMPPVSADEAGQRRTCAPTRS